jgi:hypothetical protein
MTNKLCKYINTRGKNKGLQCPIGGKDNYNGYCKRHFERHGHKEITNNEVNNIQPVEDVKEFPRRNVIDFDGIINKYQNQRQEFTEIEQNHNEEKDNIYEQYIEYCKTNNQIPDNKNSFDKDKFLKDVANDLEDLHSPKYTEDFIRESLFNLNLVAFSLVEEGSKIMKDKYPEKDLTDLGGLTKDVYDDQEIYKNVLYDIYVEHYDVIDNYISPITTYCLLSIKTIGTRAVKNKKTN